MVWKGSDIGLKLTKKWVFLYKIKDKVLLNDGKNNAEMLYFECFKQKEKQRKSQKKDGLV